MKSRKLLFAFLNVLFATAAWADNVNQATIYNNGSTGLSLSPPRFTVLDPILYQQNVQDSRDKIQQLLKFLESVKHLNANARVALISQQLRGIPFIYSGAEGEGDWQPVSSTYQPGAIHVKQDPVYRLDGLNCQTFVQVAMALLYSKNLHAFDQNILKISYGAAGNPLGEIVHYYNRNHFIDGDWNPINRRNGWLSDVTSQGELNSYSETTSAEITRQNWFLFQQKNLYATVRVLNSRDGPAMAQRYMTTYSTLNYPNFDAEIVPITYIPKEKIALAQPDGSYKPNQLLLDKIPTPAVLEIVRDVKKWTLAGKNLKDVTGSEQNISHMGILYRKAFQHGETIYQKTSCTLNSKQEKVCTVRPIKCQKNQCNELMLAGTSSSRPDGYYWYKKPDGNYTCTSKLPNNRIRYTLCNRVVEVPLFDYLTDYQYGSYWYMNSPSLIGIHIEKLAEI
jgi:hypothetical protein